MFLTVLEFQLERYEIVFLLTEKPLETGISSDLDVLQVLASRGNVQFLQSLEPAISEGCFFLCARLLLPGTQYKVTVEYAPYQRMPKPRSKKDIREGTITKGVLFRCRDI